ncbi:MAG: protein kinase [Planctomycetota bacterium]
MKVLIAEDNPMWSTLLEKNLRSWKYETVVVDNGTDALERLESDETFRLVILDWQMPGLEGIEVCRRIKANSDRPFTFIAMLTSRDSDDDLIAGLEAGADEYLTKPIEMPVLKSRLVSARRIISRIPPRDWARPQIAGYDVRKVLGKGAFATVWQAIHEATDKTYAIKIMRVDLSTRSVMQRFAREVEVMRELDHPAIAKIHDHRIDDTVGYYVMDLIAGGDLFSYAKHHSLSGTDRIDAVANVADGLQHAHEHGIIHRDLKFANVMVERSGQPKIVDFGMSKSMFRVEKEDAFKTLEGSVLGTPLFMSPEQARGELHRLDGRTDQYALGIMLYILLLKRHPHAVKPQDRDLTIQAIASGKVTPPSKYNEKFSPPLGKILLRALAPEIDDRYPTVGEFGDALRAFLRQR